MKINLNNLKIIELIKKAKINFNKDQGYKSKSYKNINKRKNEKDLDSSSVEVFGLRRIQGDISSKSLNLKGYSKISGDIDTEIFKLKGVTKIMGNNFIKDYLKGFGSLFIIKNLKCRLFNFKGELSTDGDIYCESFSFDISDPSFAKNIISNNIEIKNKRKDIIGKENTLKKFMQKREDKNILKCDYIEGRDIFIENTHVNKVKGENIKVGRGCVIGSLEYSDEVIIDKDSIVRNMTLAENFKR